MSIRDGLARVATVTRGLGYITAVLLLLAGLTILLIALFSSDKYLMDAIVPIVCFALAAAVFFGGEALADLIAKTHMPQRIVSAIRGLSIARLERSGNVAGLASILRGDEDRELRYKAAQALGRLADPRAATVLIAALEDRYVLVGAATALVACGGSDAINVLVSKCLEAGWDTPLEAYVDVLAKTNSRDAVPAFANALGRKRAVNRAKSALVDLGYSSIPVPRGTVCLHRPGIWKWLEDQPSWRDPQTGYCDKCEKRIYCDHYHRNRTGTGEYCTDCGICTGAS